MLPGRGENQSAAPPCIQRARPGARRQPHGECAARSGREILGAARNGEMPPGGLFDDEVHEPLRYDNLTGERLAGKMRLYLRTFFRKHEKLGVRNLGVDLDRVAKLAVDLNRDRQTLRLRELRIVGRPGLIRERVLVTE